MEKEFHEIIFGMDEIFGMDVGEQLASKFRQEKSTGVPKKFCKIVSEKDNCSWN